MIYRTILVVIILSILSILLRAGGGWKTGGLDEDMVVVVVVVRIRISFFGILAAATATKQRVAIRIVTAHDDNERNASNARGVRAAGI